LIGIAAVAIVVGEHVPSSVLERVRPLCPGTPMLPSPADPRARGPWPVGVRTVTIDGAVTEVLYPAKPGSDEAGAHSERYDLRAVLPPAEQQLISTDDAPWIDCDCVRGLPLDETRGPYPIVLYAHGNTLSRLQSITLLAHLASRGMIVVSPDFPGACAHDVLNGRAWEEPTDHARRILEVISRGPLNGELAWLDGHVDMQRIGLVGHSMGGAVIAHLTAHDGVQVAVDLGERGTTAGKQPFTTLVMGAMDDGFEPYAAQQRGYESSPRPRRLIGIAGAGHFAFADDLCSCASDRGGFFQLAAARGVVLWGFAARVAADGCSESRLSTDRAEEILEYAVTAALEERLLCSNAATLALARIKDELPEVREYREDL
jgi:pimeloyl-ACP methyl ester carboxylesterase